MQQSNALLIVLIGVSLLAFTDALDKAVTLGEDVTIDLGADVTDVSASTGDDQRILPLIKDGVVTELGEEYFGDRASLANGKFTIRNVNERDLGEYHYHTDGILKLTLAE